MKRKEIVVILGILLVVVLSVSVAYFTSEILGNKKEFDIVSKSLKVLFDNNSSVISAVDIEPGWSTESTFSITNTTDSTYKYNIIMQDLVNTFVTRGYLKYKITSTTGLTMDSYKNIPKSSSPVDKVLAYNIEIEAGETQEYTISFIYPNDENEDQSDDMGKVLSGKVYITEWSEQPTTLYEYILSDNPTVSTRTSFNTTFTENTTGTIFTATEKNVHNTTDTTVYYFAGNTTNNWVYFAGFYWRIIRTNADGSVR